MGEDTRSGEDRTGEQSDPRTGGGALSPIKSAQNGRTGATDVNRHGYLPPHVDVLRLPEQAAKTKGENGHADNRKPQKPQVLAEAKRFLAQWHQDILYENAAPRVQVRRIATENAHKKNGAESAPHSDGQE